MVELTIQHYLAGLAMMIISGGMLVHIFQDVFKIIGRKQLRRYKSRLYRHTRAIYELMPKDQFIMGKGLWNQKCHQNSVQALQEGTATKVILCIAREGMNVFVHYINQTEDGKYVDNTLGWQYKEFEYYFIREIREEEYMELPYHIGIMNDTNLKQFTRWPWRKYITKETEK